MDNFKIVYKILRYLESAMDFERIDTQRLCGEAFGISEQRFNAVMLMLSDSGYIAGFLRKEYIDGGYSVNVERVRITLKGLEYLEDNSIMKKTAAVLKGIKDIVPGI